MRAQFRQPRQGVFLMLSLSSFRVFRVFRGDLFSLCCLLLWGSFLQADPPVASYIFPAGGRRGTTVDVHVGGLYLHKSCGFELLGPGVQAGNRLARTATRWFEGPLLPLPDSQQAEDYPKDMAGRVQIAADAPLGERFWRLWTAQGATPARPFIVGDLPEVIEQEIDGDPVPVAVKLPVTINGRIFPRENVDAWSFDARRGQTVCAEVVAARLGSPLDSCLEVLDPQGHSIAENDDTFGADSFIRFTAPADGQYQVRIRDVNSHGGQAYVYRLTLTAGPHVDRTYPLGGRRGDRVKLELAGQALPAGPVEVALPADGPQTLRTPLPAGGLLTNPIALDLDDLPEYLETEPNDEPGQVKPLPLPAVANGRIDRPGDVDYWGFTARKGEAFEFELRAGRLGSPLSGILAVCDPSGKELARAESPGPLAEPLLRFTAPADGNYCVRVAEQFHSRGGPEYAYRLRLAHPAPPGFRLQLGTDVVMVPRAGQGKLHVQAERLGGFADPITVTVEGLPAGVTVSGTSIGKGQAGVDLAFKAEANAAVDASRLTVRGSAKVGEQTVTRTAVLAGPRAATEIDSALLAVTVPTPFKVVGTYDMRWAARGTVYQRHYQLERNGFAGPIEVSLADRQARHLQGVTGPTITVPADASEFDYPVNLPPWMETGRTCRVCVMAVGLVKDADGKEHAVSFTSLQQNEQLVAVIEPGRLSVESDRATLRADPGKTVEVAVRVSRGKGLTGPVKVELLVPEHVRGLAGGPVEVAAGETRAVLPLRFAADAAGPYNMPVTVRATLLDGGKPVVAETRVEILPAP
jgi:hypothetical protein